MSVNNWDDVVLELVQPLLDGNEEEFVKGLDEFRVQMEKSLRASVEVALIYKERLEAQK